MAAARVERRPRVTRTKAPYIGTISAHFVRSVAGRIRTYVRYSGRDGRSGARAASRGTPARGARDLRAGAPRSSGSQRSCARPTTAATGKRPAARPARSGSRRSPAATTAPPQRITQTSDALRSLPALDHALSTGALTLDQVAAAAEFATPESDAELARVAVGKAPSADRPRRAHDRPAQGGGRPGAVRAARAEHDLDARPARARASAAACRSSRAPPSSRPSGTSPSPSARATSRPARSSTGSSPPRTRSSPSPGSGGARRRRRQAQPHHADRAPQRRRAADARGRRADQPRDRRAAHLRRAPTHDQAARPRPRALPRRTLRLLRPAPRAAQALSRTASTPAAPPRANSKPTTSSPSSAAARPNSTTSSCSAPATTNSSTTTTSTPAATASSPRSQTSRTRDHHQPTTRTTQVADWLLRRRLRTNGDAPAASAVSRPAEVPRSRTGCLQDRPPIRSARTPTPPAHRSPRLQPSATGPASRPDRRRGSSP